MPPDDGLYLMMSAFLRSMQAPIDDAGRCIRILLTCWSSRDIDANLDAALDHARDLLASEKEAA